MIKLASTATYSNLVKRGLPVHDQVLRVALISSYTTVGLDAVLLAMADELGITLQIYMLNYNKVVPEILDADSQLYRFKPNLIFFFPSADLISDRLNSFQSPTRKLPVTSWQKKIIELIDTLQKNSQSLIVPTTVPLIGETVLGLAEASYPTSTQLALQQINLTLMRNYQQANRIRMFDINSLIHKFGWKEMHNPKLAFMGEYLISPDFFPQLGYQLIGFLKAVTGKTRKCIVIDLDNTMWGGIIGEDGMSEITLSDAPPGNAYKQFQKVILDFYKRGILLAINSNNNETDALEVLQKHPDMQLRLEHFAAYRINWQDKVSNMKEIAQELNIGIDSMVFIDDDPKKRTLMQQFLPQVLTLELPKDPSLYSHSLLEINDFTVLNFTEEDLTRGKKYRQQAQRKELKNVAPNLEGYLKNLEIKIHVQSINAFSRARIAQLTQRTNQFNMTTRRYTEADIEKFSHTETVQIYALEVSDRFGSYGLTAVAITQFTDDIITIDSFLLSCRILGLGIETALLALIVGKAKTQKATKIAGEFLPTVKNKPAADFYKDAGFKRKNMTSWEVYVTGYQLSVPNHIQVTYD